MSRSGVLLNTLQCTGHPPPPRRKNDLAPEVSAKVEKPDLQQPGLLLLLSLPHLVHCSGCFIVPLSHPYMTTGKTIALTRRTFVGKVMSLLFNAV